MTNPEIDDAPKKRGRRKKVVDDTHVQVDLSKEKVKKRVSKLQPVKIIETMSQNQVEIKKKANVILHLKCSLKDVEHYLNKQNMHLYCTYNPDVPNEIKPFEEDNNYKSYDSALVNETQNTTFIKQHDINTNVSKSSNNTNGQNIEIKEKIKELKIEIYKGISSERKSDCFWCTYPYDNNTCYILQYSTQGNFVGHGSFCSPECSVAHLFHCMPWDDSTKMESYQLINYYYGESDGYTQNIKPACDPHYFLEKFYGNMNIHEFRALSKSKHMLLCIDKPVTRILPELHEDNDKINLNSTPSVQSKGNYKVKKQSEKGAAPCRNSILRDNFGVSS